jgi:hypothetical protein
VTLVIIFGPPAVGQMTVTCQMNRRDAFFCPERHLRIDNTTLEPGVVAGQIAAYFSLS